MPSYADGCWRAPAGYTTESIMIAAYPEATPEWTNEAVEREVAIMMSTIQAIRSLRAQYKLQAKSRPTLWIRCKNTERLSIADTYLPTIMALCGSGTSTVINDTAEVPPGCAMAIVDDTTTVYVHLVVRRSFLCTTHPPPCLHHEEMANRSSLVCTRAWLTFLRR